MELLPFQEEAVEKSLVFLKTNKNSSVYNGSDPGLGKTIMSIETCRRLKAKKILVICPPSVIYSWINAAKVWHPGAFGCEWKHYRLIDVDTTYVVISWGVITKKNPIIEELKLHQFDVLIADEAHKIKSEDSQRTKLFFKNIWPLAKSRLYLSGTPFTQSIGDGFTIFNKCMPERFTSYWSFCHEFTNIKRTPWADVPTGVKNAELLSKIIRSNFFIRYKKKEELKHLPPRRWSKVTLPPEFKIELTDMEREAYVAYIKALTHAIKNKLPCKVTPPTSVMTMRKEQGLKRVKIVASFVKELLDQGTPVVLFFHHVEVGKRLLEELKGYNPAVILGNTTTVNRYKAQNDFQEGKTDLFIGSLTAAGIGITLTRSQTAVFSEFTYSPSEVSQAADRVHRIGQLGSVMCHYFEVEDSIDTDVLDILTDKVKAFNEVLG